jgi:hypothetical protein
MSTIFALGVIALGLAGMTAFVVVLIGVRHEDRRMRLPVDPDTHSATFARRVIGVHVRDNRPGANDADGGGVSFAVTGGACRPAAIATTRPVRVVRTAL